MKQMWRCDVCHTIRQWGTATLATAQKAVRESVERLIMGPWLTCETCKAVTIHSYSRDEFGSLDVPPRLPPSRPVESRPVEPLP